MHRTLNKLVSTTLLASALFVGPLASVFAEEATQVDVYYPTTDRHQRSLTLTGTVEAVQHSQLATLRDGVVAEIYVDRGDRVEKGQKLLKLDARLMELEIERYQAEVRSAKAAKTEATRLYEEVLGLSEQQLIPKTQMEERLSAAVVADAELNRVEALLALREEILDRHILYAPFAGVISERQINLGEWVTPEASVFTLVDQQNLRLSLQVPQEYYARLADVSDATVTLLPETPTQQPSEAKLSTLVEVVNDNSRTLTALVDLPPNSGWLAGMSARAVIQLPRSDLSISWIPQSAVKSHPDGGASVFAVEQDTAKRYQVTIIERQGERLAVQGLPIGPGVVITGIELLNDGDPVQIQNITGNSL
ncbi:efflux RND transporter periplasmic adaptor subunit [Ferrimonas marina]|uniref:RND family efflux transporter, MFP subunit n=1 Tax=Ferrimonas marina TaxID=299255 RepID=A0A1M5S0I4_9GAMM|nr:efflux RND transporter periplasmic adaptor subunit [Ferrimonas marina]SHH31959.1 RND family efflux transporter, MFP subunit [Ferrimonas marina]